jgi:hypothetical protein
MNGLVGSGLMCMTTRVFEALRSIANTTFYSFILCWNEEMLIMFVGEGRIRGF